MLLGATLAIIERASGIYTDRRRDDASALTTKVDPKQQPSRDLVDCGLLAALCAIAKKTGRGPRLRPGREAVASSITSAHGPGSVAMWGVLFARALV